MGDEQRRPGLPSVDTSHEVVAPCVVWRHIDQMLDVDGGKYRLVGTPGAAVLTSHTDAAAVLDHELGHALTGEDRAAMCLDKARQRAGESARAALWHAPAIT